MKKYISSTLSDVAINSENFPNLKKDRTDERNENKIEGLEYNIDAIEKEDMDTIDILKKTDKNLFSGNENIRQY